MPINLKSQYEVAVLGLALLLPPKLTDDKFTLDVRDWCFSRNDIKGHPLFYTFLESRNVDLYSGMYDINFVQRFRVETRHNVR